MSLELSVIASGENKHLLHQHQYQKLKIVDRLQYLVNIDKMIVATPKSKFSHRLDQWLIRNSKCLRPTTHAFNFEGMPAQCSTLTSDR